MLIVDNKNSQEGQPEQETQRGKGNRQWSKHVHIHEAVSSGLLNSTHLFSQRKNEQPEVKAQN